MYGSQDLLVKKGSIFWPKFRYIMYIIIEQGGQENLFI